MIRILSYLNIFELKKVSHFGKKVRDQYFEEKKNNGSNFEPSQNQMHMLARVIISLDDFLAISPSLPYVGMTHLFVQGQNIPENG